jgi:hypothetical protein
MSTTGAIVNSVIGDWIFGLLHLILDTRLARINPS